MLHLNGCILILVTIFMVDSQVNGDTNHAILRNKNHPDKCYLETDKGPLIIEGDQLVRYPGKCANIYCGRDSWALIFTCNPLSIPDGCELGDYINSNAAFPECCERDWKCNEI
ncbi:hypothetical protein ACLKA7_004053 [Drosophila subpalustris]